MFGLSFLNSVFLVGLASAAIPVIIHLLNRRRIRRVKFSSLEFLEEQSRRRMRKVNLRRLIILALRTLAVLLLVMAFARPSIRGAFFLPGKAARNVIVCLDASYSMGVDREEGTAFTAAREVARRVVDEAGDDDLINLIVFSDRAEPALERGTRNHALVRGAIERAQLTAEGTSIARAIDHALTLIADSDLEGGDIYVVSDFRYNTDSSLVDPERIPDDTRLYLLPVYEGDADNVSIDRVLVPRKLLRSGKLSAGAYRRRKPQVGEGAEPGAGGVADGELPHLVYALGNVSLHSGQEPRPTACRRRPALSSRSVAQRSRYHCSRSPAAQ
jgi:hypothetical protein